jgi:ribokinase
MEILTVGSAMMDTIAIIDSGRIERMSMLNADSSFLLLEEGRKTEAEEISTHPGGGAVNAAVAMARLEMDGRCLPNSEPTLGQKQFWRGIAHMPKALFA